MSTATIPLASQVGGHAGVLSSEDGSLIIKPCLPAERHFYETIVTGNAEGFQLLRPHLPKFHGVIVPQAEKGAQEPAKESLVLENLSHGFTKPNILDIKLGTVLYDDSASEEKKQRMIKSARETTSLETGVRMTGFQVYDGASQTTINTSKDYGRALKVSQLPEAFAKFFPFSTPHLSLSAPTPDSSESPPTRTTSTPEGLPPSLLLPVLKGIERDIDEIRIAVSKTEMRMVGGSVLIIYEGEKETLKKAVELEQEAEAKKLEGVAETPTLADALDQLQLGEDGVPNPSAAVPTKPKLPPLYSVKLIDFAHTKLEAGIGPDEGVVLGLESTLKYLRGRISEAEEAIGSRESVV